MAARSFRVFSSWSALLLAVLASAQAWGAEKILPPELNDKVYLPIEDVGEQALWVPGALGRKRAVFRLTIAGIACQAYTFRINELPNGRVNGTAKRWNRCKPDEAYEQRLIRRDASMFGALKAQFTKAALWRIHPQFWTPGDDQICVDGEEMVFERLDGNGYRVAEANAQCEAPTELVRTARMFVELAGEKRALALLPRVDGDQ